MTRRPRSRAPDIKPHKCRRCGEHGPFRDRQAKVCLVCDENPKVSKARFNSDIRLQHGRARSLALTWFRERHPGEWEVLFERAKIEVIARMDNATEEERAAYRKRFDEWAKEQEEPTPGDQPQGG